MSDYPDPHDAEERVAPEFTEAIEREVEKNLIRHLKAAFGTKSPMRHFATRLSGPPPDWSPEAYFTVEFTDENGDVWRAQDVCFKVVNQAR